MLTVIKDPALGYQSTAIAEICPGLLYRPRSVKNLVRMRAMIPFRN
jgi:hypothetical protein